MHTIEKKWAYTMHWASNPIQTNWVRKIIINYILLYLGQYVLWLQQRSSFKIDDSKDIYNISVSNNCYSFELSIQQKKNPGKKSHDFHKKY